MSSFFAVFFKYRADFFKNQTFSGFLHFEEVAEEGVVLQWEKIFKLVGFLVGFCGKDAPFFKVVINQVIQIYAVL